MQHAAPDDDDDDDEHQHVQPMLSGTKRAFEATLCNAASLAAPAGAQPALYPKLDKIDSKVSACTKVVRTEHEQGCPIFVRFSYASDHNPYRRWMPELTVVLFLQSMGPLLNFYFTPNPGAQDDNDQKAGLLIIKKFVSWWKPPNGRLLNLRLQGKLQSLAQIVDFWFKHSVYFCREIQARHDKAAAAVAEGRQLAAHWFVRLDDLSLRFLPDKIDQAIEKAYAQYRREPERYPRMQFEHGTIRQRYEVNFPQTEVCRLATGKRLKATRLVLEHVDPTATGCPYLSQAAPAGQEEEKEEQKIRAMFESTMSPGSAIVSIQRLEHPILEALFKATKTLMEEQDPVREIAVFHGTRDTCVESIITNGLATRFCVRQKLGWGVYFSPRACTAHSYTSPGHNGCHTMLACRLLVGQCVVRPSNHRGAVFLHGSRSRTYQTYVDAAENPGTYVSTQDHQAIPTHLIRYLLLDLGPELF
eukprot:g80117.t1